MDLGVPVDALPDHRRRYVGDPAQRHRRETAGPAPRSGAGQVTDQAAPPRPAQGVDHDQATPFQKSLGLLMSATEDGAAVEMDIRDNLRGPAGSLEGGVISTIID